MMTCCTYLEYAKAQHTKHFWRCNLPLPMLLRDHMKLALFKGRFSHLAAQATVSE
jgi:hypothetical protein